MTDPKKDPVDSFLEYILSDDSPIGPEDQADINLFNGAQSAAERKVARARLERAKAGAAQAERPSAKVLDLDGARKLIARARAGDTSAQITLAARFGDGAMDGDLDAIAEDLAELEAERREED